ncbi:MAG: TonB-dependent receptor, partial [Candidatus Solibacter sp.]|nr:TonB-dependent receptor [Candidatus Solibacter sp.]
NSGNYRFVSLVPGAYRVDIERSGFKHLTRDEIRVEVEAAVRIDAVMQVGDVGQTVEVTAQTPLLQTDSSALGQVVEARKVQEMPLNGRNVLNLVALVPGVVPQGGVMQNPVTGNNTGWGNYSIGGGQANQSAAFFDGGPLNVGYVGMVGMVPSQDMVQEFRVQTNNLSAEFGRFSGGVINLMSKSGANELHGSVYEFLRNKVLNANTFFNNRTGAPTPAFTQNQFGATAGGPIRKDKTFFFAGYEGFRVATGAPTLATVPTVAFRNGDFSNLRNASGNLIPIYDPLTSCGASGNPACASGQSVLRTMFPGNIIPANRLDKTSKTLTSLWALPNTAGQPYTSLQNFTTNTPNKNTTDQGTFRIDQNQSDKQRIFGRYTIWDLNKLPRDTFQSNTDGSTWQKSQQAVLADTYSFAPTVLGDFRFAFMRYNYDARSQTSGMDLSTIGWPATLNNQIGPYRSMPFPIIQGYPDVITASKTAVIASVNNSYTASGSVTLMRGGHTIKVGGEYRILQWNFVQVNNPSGNLSFDSLFTAGNPQSPGSTGYGYASYMLGYGTGGSASNSNPVAGQQRYRALYFSDVWQVTRKLTLTLGVRWERSEPWTERWDRETVLLTEAVSPMAAPTGLPLKGMLALVNSKDWPSRYNQDLHDKLFAPRFGFAYRALDRTVLRGGYGLFYLSNDTHLSSGPSGSPVNGITTPWTGTVNSSLTPYNVFSNPYPDGILQPPDLGRPEHECASSEPALPLRAAVELRRAA